MNLRISLVIAFVVLSLVIGQLLFRATAIVWASGRSLFSMPVLMRLVPSLAFYALSTLAWVWVLRTVTLKSAYPFMALAFVLVPLGAHWLFGETITPQYLVGTCLIMMGVIITVVAN
ncbi:4-amino-4-deoxy-L-arabinose-phospho-UDP flippase [Rhodanobacter denitrificans]|uniref:4-amino-4-deoxy-L-arabinose-phospho-UDP flippase n=1 Tax=Rhodanobacter denitrificans TaxID=666685 RepID=UPI0011C05CA9|nr:4-amino-4-deoxy-L-arabinose-phospho-UDP flippase [Rhodanobacter denitrificans]